MVNDEFYLSLALAEAWKYQLLTYPNPPVGALIVDKYGKILSISAHKKQGEAHAELECVKEAYISLTKDKSIENIKDASKIHQYLLQNHNNLFKDSKIFVTLEPCNHYGSTPPCSLLIAKLGFSEVIIGSTEKNKKAMGGVKTLKENGIKVKCGVLKKECDQLIEPFLKWQKRRFVFFKMAQNLNGTYDTGVISSKESRKFVHKLRDKIDLLVIGGNTVRTDRPTLDSRLVDGKSPDVMIYSKKKEFDKNIPLFSVKGRKVFVSDDLEDLKDYRFVMVEGTDSLIREFEGVADWYLFFISSGMKRGKNIAFDREFEIIYSNRLSKDLTVWAK